MVIKIDVDANSVINWNGKPLATRADLDLKLQEATRMEPQPEVQIRGDAKSDFESVGRVMFAVQRAGITKVGFITEPQ